MKEHLRENAIFLIMRIVYMRGI